MRVEAQKPGQGEMNPHAVQPSACCTFFFSPIPDFVSCLVFGRGHRRAIMESGEGSVGPNGGEIKATGWIR